MQAFSAIGMIVFFAFAAAAVGLAAFFVLRAYRRAAEPAPKPLAALAACGAVAALTLGLYAALGSPGRADQPHAGRMAALEAMPPEQLGPVEMIALLEDRMREHPDDIRLPFFLGGLYEDTGQLPRARGAYDQALRRAARLASNDVLPEPERAALMQAQGLALTRLGVVVMAENGGAANAQALGLLEAASQAAPDMAEPFIHRAYAAARGGDHATALGLWDAALARLDPADPMRPMAERLRGLAARGEAPRAPPRLGPEPTAE
jgi:cytochrome c-type biogenesis protein CcmH